MRGHANKSGKDGTKPSPAAVERARPQVMGWQSVGTRNSKSFKGWDDLRVREEIILPVMFHKQQIGCDYRDVPSKVYCV